MSKKLLLTFSVVLFSFFNISITKADLLFPNNSILPADVIKIQLNALMDNDSKFKDSGIKKIPHHTETVIKDHLIASAWELSPKSSGLRLIIALIKNK